MDSQHIEQTKRLEEDLRNLGNRFDRHLEIYAQNGKELSALKTSLLAFVSAENERHGSIEEKIDNFVIFFKEHDRDERELHNRFVTDDQFSIVKNIVYGATALILTGVMGALLTLVIK